MSKDRISYETIADALQQEESAIVEILLYYKKFMQQLASREIVGVNGQRYHSIDEEMLTRLEVKLMASIPKFKFLQEEKSV